MRSRNPAPPSPAPKQVTAAPASDLCPGEEAVVIAGLSAGLRGVIRGEGFRFGELRTLRIELPSPVGERQSRVDYLRRAS